MLHKIDRGGPLAHLLVIVLSYLTDIHTIQSGSKLSDHLPLCFLLDIHCSQFSASTSSSPYALIGLKLPHLRS